MSMDEHEPRPASRAAGRQFATTRWSQVIAAGADQTADSREALARLWDWIVERGPKLFGIDPTRIAMAGGSSGAYLALISGHSVRRPRALLDLPHPHHRRLQPFAGAVAARGLRAAPGRHRRSLDPPRLPAQA